MLEMAELTHTHGQTASSDTNSHAVHTTPGTGVWPAGDSAMLAMETVGGVLCSAKGVVDCIQLANLQKAVL